MNNDATNLETLLHLDGEIFPMDNGYWTKFEVKVVGCSDHIPHGIRYSLTLHDKRNRRVFGLDNAHSFKPKRKKYGTKKVTWDHRHVQDNVFPYEFEAPGELLEYFWNEVDKIIDKHRS